MTRFLHNVRPISKNFSKLYSSPNWVNSYSPAHNTRLLQLNLITLNATSRSFTTSTSFPSNLFNRTFVKTTSVMVGLTTLGVSSSSNFFTTSASNNDSATATDKPSSKGCHLTVAAAWSPKRPRSDLPNWCAADCGEDAYFVAENKSSYCIGIADGVGGWGDIGVDPSQFAWELMNNAQAAALKQEQEIDPQVVLDNSYKTLVNEGNVEAGSSTACILSVDKASGIIKSSNLGDSGYLIIRNHTPLYRSRENTHYFNAPYQLSIVPPELDRGNNIKNTPADADQDSYQLEHGDFVVLGTDGLFDNLFNEEIISTIDLAPPPNLDVANCTDNSVIRMKIQNMASELVKKSKQVANDKTKMTPFSKAAQEHGYRYSGGKIDDITVVVLYVDMAGQNQLKPHI